MKIVIVFVCVFGLALCRNIDDNKRSEQQQEPNRNYTCPPDNNHVTHLSYCAWDPCDAFIDNPHPCKNHPEAVCKYDVCSNVNCIWQFFVDYEFVECELDF